MKMCRECTRAGRCLNVKGLIVSDRELDNPFFIQDLRAFAYSRNISKYHWLDYLTDLYRDLEGCIIDDQHLVVWLNMELLEVPNPHEWFRHFCNRPVQPGTLPQLHPKTRERVRILATILRAAFPEIARFWGVRGANDNEPEDLWLRFT